MYKISQKYLGVRFMMYKTMEWFRKKNLER